MRRFLVLLGSLLAGASPLLTGCQGDSSVGTTARATAGGSGTGTTASNAGSNGTTGLGGNSGTTGLGTTTGFTSVGTSGGSTTGRSCTHLQCQVQTCPNSGHTTISGTIMDPAGKDPLFYVVAYVPNSTVQPLTDGASCDSCSSLFSGDPMAVGISDTSGKFTIQDVPVGSNIPVVVQVGKWRTHITVPTVTACTDNPVGNIELPSKMDPSDPIINIPDIAISTGSADSLECLLVRVGIDPSEYVAGDSTAGKIHIFSGGDTSVSSSSFGGVGGSPEANPMPGAPASDQKLWDSKADLMKYDMVLLSCEGEETYDAKPANLEAYLNAGGRVFASHFHYSWFSGPLETRQSYTAPSDWGTHLASWTAGSNGNNTASGVIQTTLPNGQPFPKGQALDAWLGNVGALSSGKLTIKEPRDNAKISPSNTPSTPWINESSGSPPYTLYFSFDTPVGAPDLPDGGPPQYCGRAVFSGLHVGGASYDTVNAFSGGQPPPQGCDTTHTLSPQEKALEFMLFDLSSCVVADSAPPGPVFQ